MIVKIVGIGDESYPKKETGEMIEQLRLYYTAEPASDDSKIVGIIAGDDLITAKRCPSAINELFDLGDKAVGKYAMISKDTAQFQGNSYSYVDSVIFLDEDTALKILKGGI